MFSENSVVVRAWINKIRAGQYAKEQVPDLSNLRELVFALIDPAV